MRFRDVGGGVALHSSAYHRVTQVRGGRGSCRWNCKTSNPVGRPGSVGVRRPAVSASAPRFLAAGRRYRQPEPPGPRLRPCRPSTMPGRAWSSLVFAGLVGFLVRAEIFPGILIWTELFLGKDTGCKMHGTWQDRVDMAFGFKPYLFRIIQHYIRMAATCPTSAPRDRLWKRRPLQRRRQPPNLLARP